jgi:hypothetical protein
MMGCTFDRARIARRIVLVLLNMLGMGAAAVACGAAGICWCFGSKRSHNLYIAVSGCPWPKPCFICVFLVQVLTYLLILPIDTNHHLRKRIAQSLAVLYLLLSASSCAQVIGSSLSKKIPSVEFTKCLDRKITSATYAAFIIYYFIESFFFPRYIFIATPLV